MSAFGGSVVTIAELPSGFDIDRTGADHPATIISRSHSRNVATISLSAALLAKAGADTDQMCVYMSPAYRANFDGSLDIFLKFDAGGTLLKPMAQHSPAFGDYAGGYAADIHLPGPLLKMTDKTIPLDVRLGDAPLSVVMTVHAEWFKERTPFSRPEKSVPVERWLLLGLAALFVVEIGASVAAWAYKALTHEGAPDQRLPEISRIPNNRLSPLVGETRK
jgi:hypothetical protein